MIKHREAGAHCRLSLFVISTLERKLNYLACHCWEADGAEMSRADRSKRLLTTLPDTGKDRNSQLSYAFPLLQASDNNSCNYELLYLFTSLTPKNARDKYL